MDAVDCLLCFGFTLIRFAKGVVKLNGPTELKEKDIDSINLLWNEFNSEPELYGKILAQKGDAIGI